MEEIKIFNQQDLILKVNPHCNPAILDLAEWEPYISSLCGDRLYQKEAIKNAIIYLASCQYNSLKDLITENFKNNAKIREKYGSLEQYFGDVPLLDKLFANIDLATGTGKSYVIFAVAQIMLGLGLVDNVLVLCPSVTIETGLKEKFISLSSNETLISLIPEKAICKNPRIIDANQTIKKFDICVENIHAVYDKTGSSIKDSLLGHGKRTLVLNDESHHIFNASSDQDVRKWLAFLKNSDYDFKYILGFTGTAYKDNEYFNDVIFRYSLRNAIEDKVVKNIDYVQKDDSDNKKEKFQKIYQNHILNKEKYIKLKPLTILVTKDIKSAKNLYLDLVENLKDLEHVSEKEIEDKVLIVTSSPEHKLNLIKLKSVDERDNKIEWIISVSMLTEGWDVKNVFQIVPWEDRAFNSKLLISQVLGRGLRIPREYQSPQPTVTVFNHDSWSKNIKSLVEEVLEIESRIKSSVITQGDRSEYNFIVYNLNYDRIEKEIDNKKSQVFDYSRLENEGINLDSQQVEREKSTTYESLVHNSDIERHYMIEYDTWTVDELLDRIYDEFKTRDWEGRILKLSDGEYTKNNLPSREKIRKIILDSMSKVGIKVNRLVEKNAQRILQAFSTLLRKSSKSLIHTLKYNEPYPIETQKIQQSSTNISNLRRDSTIFYSNNWENEVGDEQIDLIQTVIEDETLPKSANKEINKFLFKTPMNIIITNKEPERKFVELLCKSENAKNITSWIKSRDVGFYSIQYSMKYGGKNSKTRAYVQNSFNPDFFIKMERDSQEYIIVIETKSDEDASDENKAKYKYARQHFKILNEELEKYNINQKYIFHFLSPKDYSVFFEYLNDERLINGKFKCSLENLLEE